MKLESAETKLQDLKSNMAILGKEAAAAMAAVEAQQQRLTLQRLIAMVEAERAYHQRVLQVLDQLEGEMASERQRIEAPPPKCGKTCLHLHHMKKLTVCMLLKHKTAEQTAWVMHSYHGQSDVELTLSIGDYVVVRKVTNNGWAEGECKGKAGWFPYGYIERRDRVLASKIAEVF
uniref:SH3 domain-containing protein n=1 Tax=Salix viminalis TaxID=40686 RepID=A0A6N2MCR1_SALVM